MRKIISPNLDTVRVQAVRYEASLDNHDAECVRKIHASARIQAFGAKKCVVRNRMLTDRKGIVPYIRISGEHYTADDAWKDAFLSECIRFMPSANNSQ